MSGRSLIALVFVISFLFAASQALQFDLVPGQIRCFRENLARQQVIAGEVSAYPSPMMMLKFWIENPYKRPMYTLDDVSVAKKFSFSADVDGDFKLCFQDINRMNSYGTFGHMPRRIVFNWKSDDDPLKQSNIVTKTGLKPLEAELQRIEAIALHVSQETDHQREREATHRDTSESLNSRVAWYSLLSLSTLVILSAVQVFYIQRYLKKTKWID